MLPGEKRLSVSPFKLHASLYYGHQCAVSLLAVFAHRGSNFQACFALESRFSALMQALKAQISRIGNGMPLKTRAFVYLQLCCITLRNFIGRIIPLVKYYVSGSLPSVQSLHISYVTYLHSSTLVSAKLDLSLPAASIGFLLETNKLSVRVPGLFVCYFINELLSLTRR